MRAKATTAILAALEIAFIGRVSAQLLVAGHVAPNWMPPFEQWQSGLLPYAVLVVAQFGIIILQTKIVRDIAKGTGFFAERHAKLANVLTKFGMVYLTAMIVRYAVGIGPIIPIVFHCVLAAYILVVARYMGRGTTYGIVEEEVAAVIPAQAPRLR